MRVVIDKIDDPYYMDLVFTSEELYRMREGEMIDARSDVDGQRFYIGARMDEKIGYDQTLIWEDDI